MNKLNGVNALSKRIDKLSKPFIEYSQEPILLEDFSKLLKEGKVKAKTDIKDEETIAYIVNLAGVNLVLIDKSKLEVT